MVPKFNFGSAMIVILLGIVCIVGYMQILSPKMKAQEKKAHEPHVFISPKILNRTKTKPVLSSNAKLRNPFVPMQPSSNLHESKLPNVSQSQVPNVSTLPVLRGIMEQSGRKFAIIEYNNQSHIYAIGNTVSSYTLKGLTAFSAFLEQNGQVIEIKLGNHK